jgi:hypothetical protein
MRAFLNSWGHWFTKHQVTLVVMWDLPKVPDALRGMTHSEPIHELCWKDLTTKYIPTKTDMIRSFAFKWAYDNIEAPYFITLDDDVRPNMFDEVFTEYERVFNEDSTLSCYFDVGAMTTSGLQMRGYPYKDRVKREVAVQYGGWNGVLDYDAATQLAVPQEDHYFNGQVMPMPKGAAVTCCIMNTAWRREYTPIMWQLPMLDGRYNRVGDIWSGLFIKKTLDALNKVMVINGAATVEHRRASNPYNSLIKEAPSVWLNDNLWDNLSNPEEELTEVTMIDAYKNVTDSAIAFFAEHDKEYAKHFEKARDEWLKLWN